MIILGLGFRYTSALGQTRPDSELALSTQSSQRKFSNADVSATFSVNRNTDEQSLMHWMIECSIRQGTRPQPRSRALALQYLQFGKTTVRNFRHERADIDVDIESYDAGFNRFFRRSLIGHEQAQHRPAKHGHPAHEREHQEYDDQDQAPQAAAAPWSDGWRSLMVEHRVRAGAADPGCRLEQVP